MVHFFPKTRSPTQHTRTCGPSLRQRLGMSSLLDPASRSATARIGGGEFPNSFSLVADRLSGKGDKDHIVLQQLRIRRVDVAPGHEEAPVAPLHFARKEFSALYWTLVPVT